MLNCIMISLGAIIGAMSRYGIFIFLGSKNINLPYPTLIVNLIGCFLIGILSEYFMIKHNIPNFVKLFFITGILSSFTTFSSFALESGYLMQKGEFVKMFLYISSSVILGIASYFLAVYLIRFGFKISS